MALVRIGRRRAVGEGESFEEFFRLEFRRRDGEVDLSPSVYRTDSRRAELVRAHCEHAASFLTSPPRGGAHFNVAGLADHRAADSVGATRFLFTRLRHAEVRFDEPTLALEFAQALHGDLSARTHGTTLAELRDYARAQVALDDPEWCGFANDPRTSDAWRQLCGVKE